jgi:C_GCAxxG_C_C family probable redox protein
MKTKISERAHELFGSGFNCVESVMRSILEQTQCDKQAFRMATPFGGGLGGTKEELCGALTGGVMAIGFLAGRDKPDQDAGPSKMIAMELRKKFIAQFGCTQCQALLDKLGPQEKSEQCAYVVAQTAGWLSELLESHGV